MATNKLALFLIHWLVELCCFVVLEARNPLMFGCFGKQEAPKRTFTARGPLGGRIVQACSARLDVNATSKHQPKAFPHLIEGGYVCQQLGPLACPEHSKRAALMAKMITQTLTLQSYMC